MTHTIEIYLDTGTKFSYEVGGGEDSAREHASEIVRTGYRSATTEQLTWWPPHRIRKVKVTGPMSTKYPDRGVGT